jgi:hypothetical protein
VRARITGAGIGACTHDAAAAVGIVPVEQNAGWSLRASSARP